MDNTGQFPFAFNELERRSSSTELSFYWRGILLSAYLVFPILIYLGVIPFSYRFEALMLVTALVGIWAIPVLGLRRLGMSRQFFGSSLKYHIPTLLVVGILYWLAYWNGWGRYDSQTVDRGFFVFYFLLSGPCQEFLYRGVFFATFASRNRKGYWSFLIVSAINFSFMHVIYDDIFTLGLTFIMGLIWAYIYWKAPSFWSIALAHGIIGAGAILSGLI